MLKIFSLVLFFFATIANAQLVKKYNTDPNDCLLCRSINGIAFFGKDSGVVLSSVVSTTVNGGDSWQTNTLDSSVVRSSVVAFSDINHIWYFVVQHENALIVYTGNAGKTWGIDTISNNRASSITSLYFIDSIVGFAGTDEFSILKTTDGGKQWRTVYEPNPTKSGENYVRKIEFVNRSVGMAVCGEIGTWILRTSDGGETWINTTDRNHAVSNLQPTSLSYIDPANAYYSTISYLYFSSDSGKIWNEVTTNFNEKNFRSIHFIDPQHGIAVGGASPSLGISPVIIGYTEDGGKNWKKTIIDSAGGRWYSSFSSPSAAYIGTYNSIYQLNPANMAVGAILSNDKEDAIMIAGNNITIHSEDSASYLKIYSLLGQIVIDQDIQPHTSKTFSMQSFPREFILILHIGEKLLRKKIIRW